MHLELFMLLAFEAFLNDEEDLYCSLRWKSPLLTEGLCDYFELGRDIDSSCTNSGKLLSIASSKCATGGIGLKILSTSFCFEELCRMSS